MQTPTTRTPPTIADTAAAGLCCAAAILGPLALGGTGPWPRFALEVAMAAIAALWALSGRRDVKTLLIPVAVCGFLLLQLVPLPDGVLMNLAPISAGRWKVAREGLAAGWATISVDPAATAAAVRRMLLALAVVVAVTDLSRTPRFRRWFYTALAVSGLLVLGAAFVFPVNPDNRVVMGLFSLRGPIDFWKSPERGPHQTSGFCYLDWVTVGDARYQADGPISGDGFGSYIYSNHFANSLCLTLPAVWVLWLLYTRDRLPSWLRFTALVASMAFACWTTGGMAGSRAGTASLAIGAVVYIALIAQSRLVRWPAGLLAACGAACVLGFIVVVQGPFDSVLQCLPSMLHERLASMIGDARSVAARVAGRLFLASPLLGTGLGTYGDTYAVLQRSDHTMYFAHNDYAQVLAEAGLCGAVLLGLASWALGRTLWRFRSQRAPPQRLIDAGAWAAVAAAGVHSVFDWNMHAPANALLACIIAGLALSSAVPAVAKQTMAKARWHNTAARGVFLVACLGVIPLLARDAFTDAKLDELRRANTAARIAAMKPDSPSAEELLTTAVDAGESARRLDPANWQLAIMLGHAHLHLAATASDSRDRETQTLEATRWCEKARRDSAVTRGLPEPLPRNPK